MESLANQLLDRWCTVSAPGLIARSRECLTPLPFHWIGLSAKAGLTLLLGIPVAFAVGSVGYGVKGNLSRLKAATLRARLGAAHVGQ
jgi:hypothetical protein